MQQGVWAFAAWAPCSFVLFPDIGKEVMKRIILIVMLLSCFIPVTPAHADWRWKTPHYKLPKVKPVCSSRLCHTLARTEARAIRNSRIKAFNARRLAEWNTWTKIPIPRCTWYGESGTGPQFSRYRYTMPNSTGSGALGKFQFMASTYYSVGKYDDWSPLDQEIAGHREYWRHGTGPWQNC